MYDKINLALFLLIGAGACLLATWAVRAGAAQDATEPRFVQVRMPARGFEEGARLYRQSCSICHGLTGTGDGPTAGAMQIEPRNFRHDRFRFVSTENGVPSRADLVRTIRRGIPGGMPAHHQRSSEELEALADFVHEIRRLGVVQELEQARRLGEDDLDDVEIAEIALRAVTPSATLDVLLPEGGCTDGADGATTRGRSAYAEFCASCHGSIGAGVGPSQLRDRFGHPVEARPFRAGSFRGGVRDDELFWRIRCGMPGTPMPSFSGDSIDDATLACLIAYIRSLATPANSAE